MQRVKQQGSSLDVEGEDEQIVDSAQECGPGHLAPLGTGPPQRHERAMRRTPCAPVLLMLGLVLGACTSGAPPAAKPALPPPGPTSGAARAASGTPAPAGPAPAAVAPTVPPA